MPKFVDLTTNAPPVDSTLVKTNIIPKFEDIAEPRFIDNEPEKAPIELLAERIDTDPEFVPSNEQLTEYFNYKDKQPFSYSKVRDTAVGTVGGLLTDLAKTVSSAATDPDFALGPGGKLITYLAGGANPKEAVKVAASGATKRAATTAEAAARGTWDLSILGKKLIDKMDELDKQTWSGWADFAVKEHNKKYPKNKITKTGLYYDGYKEINPGDLLELKNKWGKTKNQTRIDAWRTMRYMLNTRANAAAGKQTILSEFFDKDVDKTLRPFVNSNVAEGGSYVLDVSAPVGFLSTPMKAGAKAPLRSTIAMKTGQLVKAGGKKAEDLAEKLNDKFNSLQKEIIETDLPQPKQIGALETGAKLFTIAGDGLEAIGKAAGQPRTLESTLQRAGRTAETQAARKALKAASNFDPIITLADDLFEGALTGTKTSLALTVPTGDEELIGGGLGSASVIGGTSALAGRLAGKKQITQKQVENTVSEWLNSKTSEERKNIQQLGLTQVEAGNVAIAELLGRGVIGKDKLSDIDFIYLNQDDYLKKFHPEVLVNGKAPSDTPVGTRGSQTSVDGTPTIYINTGYNGPRSIFHELMHGLLRFDEVQNSRAELRSYLFDSKTPDGEVIKTGWFEDGDLDAHFDRYLSMLPEETTAPFLDQFKVYKDVETESGPQRVVDETATRDRQREYIMEELEAESFANFIQQSGPTFLQQSRSIPQKLLDRWFLQDNIRKTGIMKAILSRSGVDFGADGNPTGLFYRNGKPFTNSPELNRLIRDFVRAKDTVNKRMIEDDAGERPAMTIGGRQAKAGRKQIETAIKSKDGAKIVQHFRNNDIFAKDQSGNIMYDVNGSAILLGRKEIEKLQANRRQQIMDKLSEVGADPRGMIQNANGSWRGVPTNKQLKAILEIPDSIIAPGMKDTIKDIAKKFKTPGQSIIIDYNPALNKSGIYDSNLSSGLRIAVPLGFNVSKSGNFFMTTLDVGAMNMKMADWAKTGQLKDWDGDAKKFYQDVYKYLENHQKDLPGETGIGTDKKNIINDFFGVTADNVNPITDARKAAEASMSPSKRSKAKASSNLIRSRRFDRINRIEKNRVSRQSAGTPLPMKSQSEAYRKMQQNLMPGDRSRFMPATPEPRPVQDDLGFFSRVEQVAMGDKIPNRGSGDQMLATIKKQPGVKEEELKWLGLEDYLRGKKQVTKQELTDFIRENDIQLEETILSGDHYDSFSPDKQTDFARYEEYQLPGAEDGSYREMLLRMPREKESARDLLGEPEKISVEESVEYEGANDYFDEDKTIDNYFIPEGYSIENRKDFDDGEGNVPEYITSEWNILDDRTDVVAEGSTPEEAVANLHRKYSRSYLGDLKPVSLGSTFNPARIDHVLKYDSGFEIGVRADGKYDLELRELDNPNSITVSDDLAMFERRLADFAIDEGMMDGVKTKNFRSSHFDEPNILAHVRFNDRIGPNGEKILFVEELQSDWHSEGRKSGYGEEVPDAPFKSSWHELATKRMLRYAAENGYDKLAFIDGKQTSDRYNLGNKIDRLVVHKNDESNTIALEADGNLVKSGVKESELESYVGKEVAKDIIEGLSEERPDTGGNRTVELYGDDLQINKAWAFNLYDKMIPQFLKKYGKKFGAKVEDVEVSTTDAEFRDQFANLKNFKAIDITPKMRGEDGVMGGQVRFMPAERADRKNRVSTRLPTAVAATEDPLASTLLIDSKSIFNLPPDKQKIMAGIIAKYPNIKTKNKDLDSVAKELKEQSVSNLLWLHDKVPADIRKRSKLWYDGARKITNGYTKEFQITNPAGAGVLAVLSPGKDWFMNVSLAERVIDTVNNKVGAPVDSKMMNQAKFRFKEKPALMNEVKKMRGKRYDDLTLLQKAIYVRMFDEAYNSPSYQIISPEGRKVGLVKTKSGEPANVAHQSFPFIQKAITVLGDPSKETISSQLGEAHKIRNFYNNILLPKSAKEDVTIDTHAVAAALLRPFAQKSTEVTHNFGAGMPSSSLTGAQGNYGIYADAYREAAKKRGVLPREMQSITWEAVRGLFPQAMKTEKNKKLADAIWTDYKRGKKSIGETRKQIEKLFGGIDEPDWYR